VASAAGDDFIRLHDTYAMLSDLDARARNDRDVSPRHIYAAASLQVLAARLLGPASLHVVDGPVVVDPQLFGACEYRLPHSMPVT
jgi:hypothetical protein